MKHRPSIRTLLTPLVLMGAALCSAPALADDIDIYINPAENPLQPPTTILALDLNLLGICNTTLTNPSNTQNPDAPQLCLDLTNESLLGDVLGTNTQDEPEDLLSDLLLGTGNSDASRARALCNLYGVLGVDSPVVNLPAVGFLLQPLLGGVSQLTCGTLDFLLGISLLGSIVNPLLGGFVGDLVAGLVDPLLGTVVGQLPSTVSGLLQTTVGGVLGANQLDLISLLEAILNQLVDSNVAIVVTHADRANAAGDRAVNCDFGDQASITTTRRETVNCSNGAYFLLGSTPLVDEGSVSAVLSRVVTLLTDLLNPTNVVNAVTGLSGSVLSGQVELLPPYQTKEVYAEVLHYLAGDEVFNAPLKRWDGLTALLGRDTAIEAGGNYVQPDLACRRANLLHVQLTNPLLQDDSDDTLRGYLPGVEESGVVSLGAVVREAAETGFLDINGNRIALQSFFLVQDNLASIETLTTVGANVTTYADRLGLLGLGDQIGQLLQPTVVVDASLLTPTLTFDLTAPNRILAPAFFGLFRPTANQAPRWLGNLKRLQFDGALYTDAQGSDAVDVDGRIRSDVLSVWTEPAKLPPGTSADGRDVTLGGAGSRMPISGRSNGTAGARQLFFDRVANGQISLVGLNADDATRQMELTPALGAADNEEARALMLFARGWEVGTTAAPTLNLGDVQPRPWRHGAVLHSRPVAINYGARGGFTEENPDIRILYGATDGFLRMVRNDTGVESWGFMPQAVMGQQKVLRDNEPGARFPYGVDGEPAVVIRNRAPGGGPADDALDSADDTVWAFFGLRRSGSALYALNLSNPDLPTPMWRITPDGLVSNDAVINARADWYSELGLTFSTPQAVQMRVDGETRIVLVVGGGYDGGRNAANTPLGKDAQAASDGVIGSNDARGNAVFIIDAETGALIWKATQGELNAEAPFDITENRFRHPLLTDSIPARVEALDTTGDGFANRLYVGDTGGRVWRGDMGGDDPAAWTLSPIFSVGRHDTASVATDRRFFHGVDMVPVRSPGANFDAVIIGSGNRADPVERVQQNHLYAYRDTRLGSLRDIDAVIVNEDELPSHADFADLTLLCQNANQDDCADNQNLSTGWQIELIRPGEKNLSQPLTLGNVVFFSTFVPTDPGSVVCEVDEGGSRLYGVSLLDGRPAADRITAAGGSGARSVEARAPGLPGALSMADVGTARSGTELLDAEVPRFVPIYWRERRGEDERPIPQD
ncbi:pilus assembly protein [Polycyclovorans algicola]|uniref:pilus assembly protein n=1 Tax=Polycyclovorans algicola TaxID=616992 RepID=UPI0004A6F2C7|nr:PilC/PilY family type IV pilus protein [Polycyclovorans algicola]